MNRDSALDHIRHASGPFDMVVIGGGATGVGIAVDAASRGYSVALFEQSDFGKGTSSRSTKLVHGGVRYLQQGNVPLVMEALRERGILRRNAPHLISDLKFVVPNYAWWEAPFYGIGMRVYDALAGKYGFGQSGNLSLDETLERIPTVETDGLRGGVIYHDGQFDDARLLIALARTAAGQGAHLVNYARITALTTGASGFLDGVRVTDLEAGDELLVRAKVVINATGPFSDSVRRLDTPDAKPIIHPSQGVHIVLPRRFLPGDSAVMVPHTDDGRILFAIPWHERVLIGTTDTPVDEVQLEPRPFEDELDFLLEHAARYLEEDPSRDDVLSAFAGIRPLAAAADEDADTSKISREHTLHVSSSGLLTIAGGKWTTYRKMAEDAVDLAAAVARLEPRDCVTRNLAIQGSHTHPERFGPLASYGADAPELRQVLLERPEWARPVHPNLELLAGEVAWAARREMARTVDDVLARRRRCLLLDARAAAEAAPAVAALLAEELRREPGWAEQQAAEFVRLARAYLAEPEPENAQNPEPPSA